jgi:tetratricopeptide (TPR) repeat protein
MIKKIQEIFQKKKREKVRGEYLDLIEKHPDDTRSRLKLGDLYAKEGRNREALEQYMASAEIFSRAGFHLKSIALYRQVLKLDPGSVAALRKAAQISFQYGLYSDALPYYEKLAEILRNDRKNELLLNVFDEICSLPVRETRRRIQFYEAIFPSVGAQYSDPYERLISILNGMMQEGIDCEDTRPLVEWISSYYGNRMEGHELLVSLLSDPKDRDLLVKTLDHLESQYRARGNIEEKREFLSKYRVAVERMESKDTIREKPHEAFSKSSMQVKVKMEANVYDLLKKKSQERTPGEQDLSGEAGEPVSGRSALDRLEFSDLFQTFKESIQGQVGKDDSETHYNLGIAYREMELFEDAIEEFRLAGRNPALQNDSYCMMGNCFRELGRPEDALQMYAKALDTTGLNPEQSCAIRYEKATILQEAGRDKEALDVLKEIVEINHEYRDVQELLEKLV